MSNIETMFKYGGYVPGDDDFVAHIPSGLESRDRLFNALAAELRFPSYFGNNWDALEECLCDLSWIHPHHVVIVHAALPVLRNHEILTYLHLLAHCIKEWQAGEDHRLDVVFPLDCRGAIHELGAAANSDGGVNAPT